MNHPLSSLVLLALTASCSTAASQAPTAASASASAPLPAAAPAPLVADCPAGDYRDDQGGFCLPVPKGVEPTPQLEQVTFFPRPPGNGQVLRVLWAKATEKDRADRLRKIGPLFTEGEFEVLSSQKLPGGSFSVTYDASQKPGEERFRSPTVQGVLILDTGDRVLRCEAVIPVAHGAAPRDVARSEATFLDSCRSLRALAKTSR